MPTNSMLSTTRLTICGVHELSDYRDSQVTHVVSILDPGSDEPGCLESFPPHQRLDLRFHDIVEERNNMVCPQRNDIDRLLQFGRALERNAGSRPHLLVHCYAGVSRSTAALTLLVAQALPDQPAAEAVVRMLNLVPYCWPNRRMIALGDDMLNCDGELIAAVGRHYDDMVARFPELGIVVGSGPSGH